MGLRRYGTELACLLSRLTWRCSSPRIVRVLGYHSLGTQGTKHSILPDTFEEHMHFIHTRCHAIPVQHIPDFVARGSEVEKPAVCISFDDGYQDNFEHAFPILRRFGLPAMIFVIAGKVGKTNSLDGTDLPLSDWSQLREMRDSGLVSLGAHSLSHAQLRKVSPDIVQREAKQSKEILEQHLHEPIDWFCYPKSQYTPQVIQAIQKVGYQYAFGGTGFVSPASYSFLLPRIMIWGSPGIRELGRALKYDQQWIKNTVRGWFQHGDYGPRLIQKHRVDWRHRL